MTSATCTPGLLAVLLCCALAMPAWGDTVTEQLPDGLTVTADFRPGLPDKPSILVLHGFLTTHSFNTVQVIVNELAERDYTVLAPTLSLGINARNTSLPCDAIHTHTLETDLSEIDFWTRWLVRKGARNVILVGHSSGSLQLAIYAADKPQPAVRKVIATSLINVQQYVPADILAREMQQATELTRQSPPPLHPYNMVYCRDYIATPQSYLSYIRWSRAAVMTVLQRRKVPVFAIMGGSDNRFGQDWVHDLKSTGVIVKVIPEANHFFDAAQEFDLLDEIKNCILATAPQ